jgi:predicted nucleic acid-binding protein
VRAFLDTSALLKYFVEERGSPEIAQVVGSSCSLWVSELATVEGVSVLAKTVRVPGRSRLSVEDFRKLSRALALFFVSGRCEIIPLDDSIFESARSLLSGWGLTHSLGTLDALQLASALRAAETAGKLEFYSSDTKLLNAAQAQGFAVQNPGE